MANTAPIYPRNARSPSVQIPVSATALTRTDGVGTIGTDLFLLDTSATPDGTFYRFVLVKPFATAQGTNTTATVVRLFKSTVTSGATTAANTHLVGEVQIPLLQAAASGTSSPDFVIPLNVAIGAGETLLAATSVAQGASVGFKLTAICGDL